MTFRLTAAAVLVCGGLLLACSDDEPSEADAAAVDALADRLSSAESRLQADEDEARCVAEDVVDELGAERVEDPDFRLVKPALSDDEADEVYAAYEDCMDLADRLTESLSGAMSTEEARCGAIAYIESGLLEQSMFSKANDPLVNAEIDSTIAQAVARC